MKGGSEPLHASTNVLGHRRLSTNLHMVSRGAAKESTFRTWLAGRQATEELLHQYISSLAEWRASEMKAAVEDVNFPLREGVCAISHYGGGEGFLGGPDDRFIRG